MKVKKILTSLAMILALGAVGNLSFPDDSEAKRFGSRSSIGRSVTPKATTPPASSSFSNQSQNQSQANLAGGTAAASRTGMGGMFGGMFGGLLAGTLLGSMLGGGAFTGGGMLDIIIIGGIAYLAYRFFASRRNNNNNANNGGQNYSRQSNSSFNRPEYGKSQENKHVDTWGQLRSNSQDFQQDSYAHNNEYQSNTTASNVPASFNEEEFLSGAKMLYNRMQDSWDKRELDDIMEFTTPSLFVEIKKQHEEDLHPSTTEILFITANLLEVQNTGSEEYAAVLFDVQMRENGGNSEQVKEIWNFTRSNGQSGSWKLDGIQQV